MSPLALLVWATGERFSRHGRSSYLLLTIELPGFFLLVLRALSRRYLACQAAVSGCLRVPVSTMQHLGYDIRRAEYARHAGTFAGSIGGRLKRRVALVFRCCRRNTSGGHDMDSCGCQLQD